jgi:hypothetical protein
MRSASHDLTRTGKGCWKIVVLGCLLVKNTNKGKVLTKTIQTSKQELFQPQRGDLFVAPGFNPGYNKEK